MIADNHIYLKLTLKCKGEWFMLDTIEVEINELFNELIIFSDELIEERFFADILLNDLNRDDLNRNFDKFIFTKSTSSLKSISLLLKNNDFDGY